LLDGRDYNVTRLLQLEDECFGLCVVPKRNRQIGIASEAWLGSDRDREAADESESDFGGAEIGT
jgi:hypothetical protein